MKLYMYVHTYNVYIVYIHTYIQCIYTYIHCIYIHTIYIQCIYTYIQWNAQLCLTLCSLWAVAHQASLWVDSFRQEHWIRLPFPPAGDLPDPGSNPHLLGRLHWQVDSFTTAPPGKWHHHETEWNRVLCREVDGSNVCHIERSKSQRKKQIPCSETYMWNLEKW